MKHYLSAFLPFLAVISLAAAQAAAPNAPASSPAQSTAPADTSKGSAPPDSAATASAPSAPAQKASGTDEKNASAVAKTDTAIVKTSAPAAKNEKKVAQTSRDKQPPAAAGAVSAQAKPDSTKAKTSPVSAPKTPSPLAAGKTAPALAKPDSAKAKIAPAAQAQQVPQVLTSAPAKPDTSQTQLPSLPPMRNAITTEKEVKGMPDGVIQKPKTETPAPSATESPASSAITKAATPLASESGSAPQTQAGAAAAAVPPALSPSTPSKASASGKADSSAVAILPPQKKDQQPASSAPSPAPGQAQKPRKSDTFREELTLFNSPTGNLRTMKVVIDDQYNLVGMVYGEELGFVRILTADNNGNFTETWKSPPLNSPVRGVYVDNLDNTGEAEIIAYTAEGNIFIFGYDSHELKYKTPDGTYQGINCMLIDNVDTDPQMELLFITKAGKMVQFDPVTKFEEWTSTEIYTATDMVMGNVDNDRDIELILNTGEVLNLKFKSVEWKMEGKLVSPNSRLYLMDVDNDGILELIIQYDQSYVRIIDMDQRREKW